MVLLVGAWSLTMADPINIGNGFIGTDATGSLGTDPNSVGNGSDISVYPHGSASITNDFLLVFIVPNNNGNGTTSIFSTDPLGTITVYNPYPGGVGSTSGTSSAFASSGEFGLTKPPYTGSDGYFGNITGSSGTKVGSYIGAGLSNSINLSKVEGFSSSAGVNATSFGVYALLVTSGPVPSGALVDIMIPGGLPLGTSMALVTDTGDANPWTTAGGVDAAPHTVTPEPASLLLFGSGLLGLGFFVRRKFGHSA